VLYGRYEQPSDDLKRLLLGHYGPFPFYDPPEWIYEKVLEKGRTDGKKWHRILAEEGAGARGMQSIKRPEEDFDARRQELERELGRSVNDEELCLYLMFPRDALNYFRFEKQFGKTWLLPPNVWYHRGRFPDGTRITFADDKGKSHYIDIVSTQEVGGVCKTSCIVDYHFKTFSVPMK
jgi:pyruvate carboxylase